jgi:hypothetical protein
MADIRTARRVETVLRCYPARWRRRHGEEAAELAVLLMRDGIPARSILLSYLTGAVRERLTPRLGRRLGTVVGALLAAVVSLGVSLGVVFASVPAKAASTTHPGAHAVCQREKDVPVRKSSFSKENSTVTNGRAENGHGQPC